ncbi:ankyrin repeat family A protein 2-like isoform X2 [Halichondria panicea]|uniref:ankyrin repeat family A protein 2-like isoform X2 n=1 Tax=Halichondria panicea TaxID=6063 RepID=UPI00312BC95D
MELKKDVLLMVQSMAASLSEDIGLKALTPHQWRVLLDLAKTSYHREHRNAVLAVLDHGVDVNNYTDPTTGLTLLLCACLSGQKELVTTLLDKGAHPKAVTTSGHSALSLATWACNTIEASDPDLLDLLACRGVEVNQQDCHGNTALSIAALWGRADVVTTLLQNGADPDVCGGDHVRPLDLAEGCGNNEVARLLVVHSTKH